MRPRPLPSSDSPPLLARISPLPAARRRKGAPRPYGMGLRPTLPPPCRSRVEAGPGPAHVAPINEQVAKAEQAVPGKASVKRNRFVTLIGGDKTVNRDLDAKAGRWQGSRATPPTCPTPRRSSSSAPSASCGGSRKSFRCSSRPARPADLAPQARVHRGSPRGRVRRPRGHPLRREAHRVDPALRPDRAANAPPRSEQGARFSPPKTPPRRLTRRLRPVCRPRTAH